MLKPDKNIVVAMYSVNCGSVAMISKFIFFRKLMNWWNRRGNILKKFRGEQVEDNSGPISNLQWEADYYLTPIPRNALFYEYLEMGRDSCTLSNVLSYFVLMGGRLRTSRLNAWP